MPSPPNSQFLPIRSGIQLFLFPFFFWIQGLHLFCVCDRLFQDRVSGTICPGWLRTAILLIFASWVARIISVSHWHLATFLLKHAFFVIKNHVHVSYFAVVLSLDIKGCVLIVGWAQDVMCSDTVTSYSFLGFFFSQKFLILASGISPYQCLHGPWPYSLSGIQQALLPLTHITQTPTTINIQIISFNSKKFS
jgi:hypothetical protein